MTLTVRRRAVCALALLALLCGCCASFVCGATGSEPSTVPVQLACKREGELFLWRFPGEGNWTPCTKDVRRGRFLECSALCHDVEEQYQDWECATACAGANEDAVAFTMNFQRDQGKSGFCRDWPASSTAAVALSETPDICQPPSAGPVLPEVAAAGKTLRGDEAQPPAAPAAGTPAADGAGGAEKRTDAAAKVGSPDSSSPPPTDPAPEGGSGGPAAPRDWTTFISDAEMMLRKSADGGVVVRGTAAPLLLLPLLLGDVGRRGACLSGRMQRGLRGRRGTHARVGPKKKFIAVREDFLFCCAQSVFFLFFLFPRVRRPYVRGRAYMHPSLFPVLLLARPAKGP
ncbi:uncharacterized protein Tco025E_09760 [Trypanosoma conorhini]|uniref:Mucin-like glycoprotein n=1 Tax=Trypanosoma conorhini TaxID=83891 RepID=A0A3R7R6Z0_9TRYP|nr:uncharacterized protein Tco025E_09760 [Trypanosoma conorhini]RNE97050.1 hypothetical protein Tco025E_09760 [Trypanosoma conorhini]